jgi:serine protease
MTGVKVLFSGLVALLLASVGFAPAKAATTALPAPEPGSIAGLLVEYVDAVSAVSPDGETTGENSAGVALEPAKKIADNWYSIDFSEVLNPAEIAIAAVKLDADPRVKAVNYNYKLVSTAVNISPKTAIRAASSPRTPVAKDAWVATSPARARVKLTWLPPSSLYGAAIVGYRIEQSLDSKVWSVYKANTGNRTTSTFVTSGMTPGVRYYFRVKAITSIGGTAKLGLASAARVVLPTATPQAPVFAASNVAFNGTSPVWITQNLRQRGGLPVSYVATASASGQASVTCKTSSTLATPNQCAFAGLSPSVTYKVRVVATNARGSISSANEVTPKDPLYSKQWYLSADHGINATFAWAQQLGSRNVVVAILDSGISNHPDLDSQVIKGYDFVANMINGDGDGRDSDATDPGDFTPTEISSWHGTHVAGLIGAAANNIGISGVAPNVRLQPIRVLGNGGGESADLIAAIRWAAGLVVAGAPINPTPAKVINMSISTEAIGSCTAIGSQDTHYMEDTLALVKLKGVSVITAAGNSDRPAGNYFPGNCFPTINVGAVGFDRDKANYSNYGEDFSNGVDISAPGGDSQNATGSPEGTQGRMLSTINKGTSLYTEPDYGLAEGTSMAAPVVTGVVALMYSTKPLITPDQVWNILRTTTSPFKVGGICETTGKCGVGIINAAAAVAAAASLP